MEAREIRSAHYRAYRLGLAPESPARHAASMLWRAGESGWDETRIIEGSAPARALISLDLGLAARKNCVRRGADF